MIACRNKLKTTFPGYFTQLLFILVLFPIGHIEQEGEFLSHLEETSEWTQATFFLINVGDPLTHMHVVIWILV